MPATDIASAIERSITSQSELLTSLSLAAIGGLLIMLLHFRMHNAANPDKPVDMRWFPAFCGAVLCFGLSIVCGYVLSGMLVDMAPQLFSHSFDETKRFIEQDFGPAPLGWLRVVSILQFVIFLIGIGFGTAFILKNRQ